MALQYLLLRQYYCSATVAPHGRLQPLVMVAGARADSRVIWTDVVLL